jgi:hypothetical protein
MKYACGRLTGIGNYRSSIVCYVTSVRNAPPLCTTAALALNALFVFRSNKQWSELEGEGHNCWLNTKTAKAILKLRI